MAGIPVQASLPVQDLSAGGGQQAGQSMQQGGFTCSVGTQYAPAAPGGDVQVKVPANQRVANFHLQTPGCKQLAHGVFL